MPRDIHWTDLRVGIIGAAATGALVVAILFFARVGQLPGKKATLYVVANDATGVLKGTDIWLAGQKIGQVSSVGFRPITADTSERIIIAASVVAARLPLIRRDSHAQIKPGTSMIGIPVVFITAGSSKSPAVHDGDTLHVAPSSPVAKLGDSVTMVIGEVSGLSKEVQKLSKNMSSSRGTVGALTANGVPKMPNLTGGLSSLGGRAAGGNGSIARLMRGNIGARVSRTLAGVDSIKALVSSDRGSLGRFRRDSTLPRTIADMMARVDTLRGLLSDPVGSIAKAHKDSVLIRALANSHASLDSLLKDVKKHPLHYVSF